MGHQQRAGPPTAYAQRPEPQRGGRVAVYQELRPARLPVASRFGEWECSGCGKERPSGDIHWSDDAENNGLGFCSACAAAGPKHRKLKEGDTLSRVTKGSEESP